VEASVKVVWAVEEEEMVEVEVEALLEGLMKWMEVLWGDGGITLRSRLVGLEEVFVVFCFFLKGSC
jgi:hypothetical protein